MDTMNVKQMIAYIGEKIGVADLAFDETGNCSLMADDTIVNLAISRDEKKLYFYTRLGQTPESKPGDKPGNEKEKFYLTLLEANLFWKHTGGATIGVNRNTGDVILAYATDTAGLTVPALETMMENFITVSEKLTRLLYHKEKAGSAPVEDGQGRADPDGQPQATGPHELFHPGIRI